MELRGPEARVPPRLASKGKVAGLTIVSAFLGVWLAWEAAAPATCHQQDTWERSLHWLRWFTVLQLFVLLHLIIEEGEET